MSLLDELRNAPEEEEARRRHQIKEDWDNITELLFEIMKCVLKYWATEGYNDCRISLKDCIESIEEENTYKDSHYNENGDTVFDIEFENSVDSQLWERVRQYFYFYMCDEIHSTYEGIYNYPNTFGMKEKHAIKLATAITNKLKSEGLTVDYKLSKTAPKYHIEKRFVKYTSNLDKLFSGKEGYYTNKEVEDENMYTFELKIHW